MEAELEQLQAVQDERSKWEAREDPLVQQLRELQSQLARKGEPGENRYRVTEGTPGVASRQATICPPQRDGVSDLCRVVDVSTTHTDNNSISANAFTTTTTTNTDSNVAHTSVVTTNKCCCQHC